MITVRMLLEILRHEACVLQAYQNPGDVLTWGVGVTSYSGHRVERYRRNPQSIQKCIDIFVWLIVARYLPQVQRAVKRPLSESELTAILSFHWNTGAVGLASWIDLINAGNVNGARAAIMLWDKPASLIGRRKAERDLFFSGVWSASNSLATIIPDVHKNLTPDWSSSKKVHITPYLEAAMAKAAVDFPEAFSIPSAPAAENWWRRTLRWFAGLWK